MAELTPSSARPTDPMVSVDWLVENLDAPNILAVDATWCMPGDPMPHPDTFIRGALFDIDTVADPHASLPHMLPSKDMFENAVRAMGVSNDTQIICYDRHGLFSAPRLWWTFRAFGHEHVQVLDGGLPAWLAAGHPTEASTCEPENGDFVARYNSALVKNLEDVRRFVAAGQIIDARPSGRFDGLAPEPRADLSSGHIPDAINIPFSNLKSTSGKLKSQAELSELFRSANINLSQPVITSCGSGITACGVALALARLGVWDAAVYDGSWVEWASTDGCPIEKAG